MESSAAVDDGKAVRIRAYVFTLFCATCFFQGLAWGPLAASPKAAHALFPGLSDADISQSLAWGPDLFLPFCGVALGVLNYGEGDQGVPWCVRISAICTFLCLSLRLLAASFGLPRSHGETSLTLVQLSGAFCGVAAPFTQGAPSRVSAIWFSPQSRATSTAVGFLTTYLGTAGSYAIAQSLGDSPLRLLWLLRMETAISAFLTVAVLIFFPARPTFSGTSEVPMETEEPAQSPSLLQATWKLLTNSDFWLIMLSAGFAMGGYQTWASLLAVLLDQYSFTSGQTASLAFWTQIAMTAGSFGAGKAADKWFPRRLKAGAMVASCFSGLFFVVFALQMPCSLDFLPVMPTHFSGLFTCAMFGGFLIGGVPPLLFELAAEITYPVSEGVSGNLIALAINVMQMVAFPLISGMRRDAVHLTNAATCFLAGLSLVGIKEQYFRAEAQEPLLGSNSGGDASGPACVVSA